MPTSKQLDAAIEAGIRCRVERYRGRGRNLYWVTREDKKILSGPYNRQAIGIEAQLAIHAGKAPPPPMEGALAEPARPLEHLKFKGRIVMDFPRAERVSEVKPTRAGDT